MSWLTLCIIVYSYAVSLFQWTLHLVAVLLTPALMDELLVLVYVELCHFLHFIAYYCERRVRTKTGLPIESDFIFYQKICNLAWLAATKSYGTSEKIQERTSHGKQGLLVRVQIGHHGWQWRIQECKNRGPRSRRGLVFEVWRLFWCPFTHTLCFCSESRE